MLGHTRIETTKNIYAQHVPKFTENFALVLSASLPSAVESFLTLGAGRISADLKSERNRKEVE